MRAKQFYGSGARMNIQINGQTIHQLKSGHRLICTYKASDTLHIQIVYPLAKSYTSKLLTVYPSDPAFMYLNVYYWGTGFNPKMFITHERPEFNIEIQPLDENAGRSMFSASEKYKDDPNAIQIFKNAN